MLNNAIQNQIDHSAVASDVATVLALASALASIISRATTPADISADALAGDPDAAGWWRNGVGSFHADVMSHEGMTSEAGVYARVLGHSIKLPWSLGDCLAAGMQIVHPDDPTEERQISRWDLS